MKITKSQLKNLIKEELAAMSENTPEVPKNTEKTLAAFEDRLGQFLQTQDDIAEIIPLVLGLLDLLKKFNPQDYTESEQKRTLDMLIRAFQSAKREKPVEPAPETASV